MQFMIKILMYVIMLISFSSCGKYMRTPEGRKYKVSAKEYRIEKWCSETYVKIETQPGIKSLSDSLSNLSEQGVRNRQTISLQDSLFRLIDSAYRTQYENKDTLGESSRFNIVFCQPLRQAIVEYSSYLHLKSYGQIWIVFYTKNNSHYFYLTKSFLLSADATGYALYNDRIQIAVFDHSRSAKQVIAMKKLKKYPYYRYRPIGIWGEGGYDGPLDVYKILGKDSIEFIGRGYLDKERNFHPETRQAN